MRTLGILRREFRIPLQTLRKVASELEKYVENPWSDIVLYVRDKDVAFKEPSTGKTRSVLRGQYEANIPLKKVAHDVVAETRKLQQRPKGLVGQVEKHRYIQHNANVIAGTRISTKAILRYREAGFSTSAILREYPLLERADVEAALAYEDRLAKSA